MASQRGHRRPSRFAFVYANIFEFAIALSAVIVSAAFAINPSSVGSPALHETLHGADWAWYGLYLLGGLHILVGLALHGRDVRLLGVRIAGDGRVELAGLCFLATALIVNQVSLIAIGLFASVGMVTYAGLLLACVIRARVLMASRKAQITYSVPSKGGET